MLKQRGNLTKEQAVLIRKLRQAIEEEAQHVARLRELELELKAMVSYLELLDFSITHMGGRRVRPDRWAASSYHP
jgi:hypothetical protein